MVNPILHLDNQETDFQNEAVSDDITLQIASDIMVGNQAVIQNIIKHTSRSFISSPYPFLAPYDISDKERFYGRNNVTRKIAKKIVRHKIITLSGIAGCGKTSLLHAGLIPLLANNGYIYVYFREYSEPLQQLRDYLSQYNFVAEAQFASLIKLVQSIKFYDNNHIVIFFDQFERFLTQVSSSKRYSFIKSMQLCLDKYLLKEQKIKINFVFILQQNYLGQMIADFETVLPNLLSSAVHLNLLPLNQNEAREAIIKPLTHLDVNISYDNNFVDDFLLKDLANQTEGKHFGIYPPYLQIIGTYLYEAAYHALEQQSNVVINQQLYEELGGTQTILNNYLDDSIKKIATDSQQVSSLRLLLKTMVQTTGTCRFVTLENLLGNLSLIKPELVKLIEQLRERGLIETHNQTFSIAYEFMIAKINIWFDEREIEDNKARKILKHGLIAWQTTGTLLTEAQVTQIRQWLPTVTETEQRLLSLSETAYQRAKEHREAQQRQRIALRTARQKTIRRRLIAAMTAVLISIGVSIYLYEQAVIANQAKNQALRSQSLFLADLAGQQTVKGNALNGILLALEGLPLKKNRPYVAEVERQLYDTVIRPYERYTLTGHNDTVFKVSFSPDNQWMVTASGDNTARIWAVQTGQLHHVLQGHTSTVFQSTFSPDSQYVLTSSNDKTARLWEVSSGQLLQELTRHNKGIYYATFSPNGQQIVTVSQDQTARLWETNSGRLLHILEGHQSWIKHAAFSPSGWRLVTASGDNTARLWDVTNGRLIKVLKGHTQAIYHTAFSPDGQYIVTVSTDNTARLWDARSGQLIHILAEHHFWVAHATFSPDSQHLITADFDGTARLWAVSSGQLLNILKGHEAKIYHTAFSPDGQYVVTASFDNTARLWKVATGQLLHLLRGHQARLYHATFSPDGQYLLTASQDQTARVWEVASNKLLRVLQGHEQGISQVAFSPDSQYVVTASADQTAQLWTSDRGQLLNVFSGHQDSLTDVTFSSDGQYLVTSSQDNTARLWRVATGQLIKILKGHEGTIWRTTFSPQNQLIITASADKTARIWSIDQGEPPQILKGHDGSVLDATFSPDGQLALTASQDKAARLWKVANGELVKQLLGHEDAIVDVAFSPNGQWILTAAKDKTARLWEVKSGLSYLLKGHEGALTHAAFSPNGQQIITASEDKTARLWEMASGQLLNILSGHEQTISHVAWSPDSNRVVTASADKTARLWDVASGQLFYIFTAHQAGVTYAQFSPNNQQLITTSAEGVAYLWPVFPNSLALVKHALEIVGERQLMPEQRQQFFLD